MNKRTKITAIPIPSREYTRSDFDQAFRKFNQLIEFIDNPGDLVGSRLIILSMAETGYDKPVGTFYADASGVVRVVQEGDVFAPSFLIRVNLREVTVST